MIRSAEKRVEKGDYRTAQIELRNAIRLAPQSGNAHRLLGLAFLKAGEPAAAEAALRKALVLAAPAEQVVPLLAQAQLRGGRFQQLIDEFDGADLQGAAANASLKTSVGLAWLARGDTQHAQDAFSAALASVAQFPPARLGQARLAARAGRADEALQIADEVLRADPRLSDAYTLKAQLLFVRGDDTGAIDALGHAVTADPTDLSARVALTSLYVRQKSFDRAQALLDQKGSARSTEPVLGFLRAVVAMNKGDLPRARDEAARLRHQAPGHVPTLMLSAQIELKAGSLAPAETFLQEAVRAQPAAPAPRQLLVATLIRLGRPGQAIDVLQPLLKQPEIKDARLLLLAGEAYLASGDLSRASEYFELAKAEGAGDSASRLRLGQIALMRGQMDSAIGELQSLASTGSGVSQGELMLVALHMRRLEADKALAAAEALIKKDPNSPLGHVLAGRSLLLAKDASRAKQRFEAALKIQPDHLPALEGLADVALQEGRPAEATRRLEALAAQRPNDEGTLLALADVQQRSGEFAKAEATLRRAFKSNPQSVGAAAALVRYLAKRQDFAAAVAAAQDAVARNPGQAQLLELLGNTQEAAGAGHDAVKTFRELAQIEPQAPVPWLKLAAAQAKLDDLAGAIRSLKQARTALPDNEAIAKNLVTVYIAANKHVEALALAKEMQARHPDSTVGHVLEGEVHLAQRAWRDAEAAYRSALKADPESGASAVALAKLYFAAGRKSDEMRLVKDWLSKNPTDLFMREYAAEAAMRARDFQAAAQHYEVIAQQAPYSAAALSRYAGALAKLKDPKAREAVERAVALAPDNVDVLDMRATMLLDDGKPQPALELLTRALRQAPDRLDIRLHHAVALLRTGKTQDARNELRRLQAVRDDFAGKQDIPALLAGT